MNSALLYLTNPMGYTWSHVMDEPVFEQSNEERPLGAAPARGDDRSSFGRFELSGAPPGD